MDIQKMGNIREVENPDTSAKKIKCPRCGATEVTFIIEINKFRCDFCRTEFEAEQENVSFGLINTIEDIKRITGENVSPGMGTLIQNESEILSFRCPNCRAELSVASGSDITSLRCHWCRHIISTADKITNGVRPDGILPFTVPKEVAYANIHKYLKKRSFFAHPKFKKEFRIESVQPVYLPYVVVDAKIKSQHDGQAAIRKRKYSGGKNNNTTYYDYDLYNFGRMFNLYVNDLLVEANLSYVVQPGEDATKNSKNIVNSIQPFDMDKVIPYDPRFLLGGFRAEFRNVNLETIRAKIGARINDVSMYQATQTMKQYTHGMKFVNNSVTPIGHVFNSILAPLWLYSYQDDKKRLHYICVNGQTGETAASIPICRTRLFLASAVVQVIGTIAGILWIIFVL